MLEQCHQNNMYAVCKQENYAKIVSCKIMEKVYVVFFLVCGIVVEIELLIQA